MSPSLIDGRDAHPTNMCKLFNSRSLEANYQLPITNYQLPISYELSAPKNQTIRQSKINNPPIGRTAQRKIAIV
jgi:hypothetical protein